MPLAIDIDKPRLRDFCRKWKVTEFALFGSVTRDDFGPDSDVDVIVAFAPDAPRSLDAWMDMREELQTIFGRDVDLIERHGLARMRNYLRRDAILDSVVSLDVA
jgi:predicted nucleotidyltransferase